MNLRPRSRAPFALLLLLTGCLFLALPTLAQQNLASSRTTSFYTYVFQITDAEARLLYEKGMHVARESFFHTKIDSFPTGLAYQKRLPQGHYLLTYAAGADLEYSLTTVTHSQLQLLKNHVDLAAVVYDTLGQIISTAQVKLNRKEVPFDAASHTYRLAQHKKGGLLSVTHQGFTSYVPLDGKKNKPPLWKMIVYRRPVSYLWHPFRDVYYSLKYHNPQGMVQDVFSLFDGSFIEQWEDNRKPKGFLALNKPMYQPGDTVRYKAFIVKKNGRPYQKPLIAEIWGDSKPKRVGKLTPYRPGAYEGSFVLHDSLQQRLDRNIHLDLVREKKYDDQDIISTNFRYEDYELKENTFTIRLEQKEHYAGTTNQVIMRGADANGLTLTGARVELTMLTRQVRGTKEAVQFIPDTLWVHQQPLENSGETTIALPASIFPKARIEYEVVAAFLNSNNERTVQSTKGTYSFEAGHLQLTLRNDSVLAQYKEGEKSVPKAATLVTWNSQHEKLQTQPVQLPALLPLQPTAREYELRAGKLRASLPLKNESANLQFYSERTGDSLFLTLQNPRRLPFWYFIYRNNQLIDRGQDTTALWNYHRKASHEDPYYASVQYLWAGQVESEEYSAPFRKKELDIQVQSPATVYPGQQTMLTLEVKDAKGKPAPDVDLTAYALTSKFKNASSPKVPSLGVYRSRKSKSSFKIKETATNGAQLLQWQHWRKAMGLDSLAYYQLLYPEQGLFTNYAFPADSLTQFAPFVVDSGRVVPVHVIYLNQVPVYFSGTDVVPPYSFPTDSGYHHLKLRTAKHLITVDSVYLKHGQKLILSIDQNKMPGLLKAAEKGKLTDLEQGYLTQYLLPLEQNFTQGLSYLSQGRVVQFLPNGENRGPFYQTSRNNPILAGPFKPSSVQFHSFGNFTTSFTHEGNYLYRFEPGLLKMRERKTFPGKVGLRTSNDSYNLSRTTLAEVSLTEKRLLQQWEATQSEFWLSKTLERQEYGTTPGTGRLQWQLDSTFKTSPRFVFLYKPNAANHQIKMHPGSVTQLPKLEPSAYHLVLVFPDHSHVSTLVQVKPNGVLRLNFTKTQSKPATSETRALENYLRNSVEALRQRSNPGAIQMPAPTPPEPEVYRGNSASFSNQVRGRVLDRATGEPMPGVTVHLKGTSSGAATNAEGNYTINAPADGVLVYSFIGYTTQEVPVKGSNRIDIQLTTDARALNEVVVVGYGQVSALQGRVAGVAVTGATSSIRIRGVSSIQGNSQPLIIVDGIPFTGNLADLGVDGIATTTTLKDAAAAAIYGAAAANGVIIITTKKGKASAQTLPAGTETDETASIRSYFSDYAFWQPRLTTDKQGKITFPVTFPGDVTSWKAHVLAMDGGKRSGSTSTEIRSFKALMATLSGPRFLIEGDKTQIIGKAVNYLPDTATVQTRFAFNGQTLREQQSLKLARAFTDTIMVQAPAVAPDSVELLFILQQGNGFSDGERRHIGVYKKGVLERKGQFLSLVKDTTVTLTFDPAKGPVHFYAQGNLLQVMLDEISFLHRYEFWCNEQAASKLKGLLWEKRIQTQLGKPFAHDKMVRRLIRHLEKTQKQDGTWSWWETGPAYLWISHHATEALVMSQQEGYVTNFKKQPLVDYLTFQVEKKDAPDKIRALELLHQLQAKVDFAAYVSKLEKQPKLSLEEQLRLTRLRQQLKMAAPLDTLQKYRNTTMLGGLYWGKEKSNLFDNHISNTLLAYDILKAVGNYERDLLQIQAYLLNERRSGHWRNTYESARILETLLPDLVKEKGTMPENSLVLSGALNATLKRFPVDTTFVPTQPLTLRKQGSLPLYLTTYQNEWITQPSRVDKDFVVRTSFAGTQNTSAVLAAGKPVALQVEIEVKADASYVMIEVPIPAGCSYDTKSSWGRHEAHREYFRQKVAIFSNHLEKGTYTFTIQLLPRYKGMYTLNPAKAELMYFPTFFGREGLKTVEVK
jgi:alpha-2-macroglobulin